MPTNNSFILQLDLHPLVHDGNYTVRDSRERWVYNFPSADTALMKLVRIPNDAFDFLRAKAHKLPFHIHSAEIADKTNGELLLQKKCHKTSDIPSINDRGLLDIISKNFPSGIKGAGMEQVRSLIPYIFRDSHAAFLKEFPYVLETRHLVLEGVKGDKKAYIKNEMHFYNSLRPALQELNNLNIDDLNPGSIGKVKENYNYLFGWQVKKSASNVIVAKLHNNSYLYPYNFRDQKHIYLIAPYAMRQQKLIPEFSVFKTVKDPRKMLIAIYDKLWTGPQATDEYKEFLRQLSLPSQTLKMLRHEGKNDLQNTSDTNARPKL